MIILFLEIRMKVAHQQHHRQAQYRKVQSQVMRYAQQLKKVIQRHQLWSIQPHRMATHQMRQL